MKAKYVSAIRAIPVVCVMAVIFYLSHQPGKSFSLPNVFLLDKIGHFILYGTLASAALLIPSRSQKEKRPILTLFCIVLFSLLYGVSDEFHQTFIEGREASGLDVMADLAGVLFVCILWLNNRFSD